MKGYKRKRKIKNIIMPILILLSIGIGYYLFITYKKIEINKDEYTAEKVSVSTQYDQNVESDGQKNENIADVIEEVSKSICGISKLTNTGSTILSMATESELGLGTGVIVSKNGYVLSNSHVTGEKYSTCYVTIEDGDTYRGTVVWSDADLDLSITKIPVENLPYVTLGSSGNIRVGERVYAIGNPIGYEFRKTVTSGIISATNRTVKIEENEKTSYMSNLIQTDATINPGNSGGPLICSNGNVIGINSIKITTAEGIGFAIPIDVVAPVIDSFIQNDSFEEASLGVYVYDEAVAQYLDLQPDFSSGIYIAQVLKNSAAYESGLKEGDIINQIDGIYVKKINDLKQYIYSKAPGDIVTLNITRNKNKKDVKVVLNKKN